MCTADLSHSEAWLFYVYSCYATLRVSGIECIHYAQHVLAIHAQRPLVQDIIWYPSSFLSALIPSAPDQSPQLNYCATCLSNGRILARGTAPTAQKKTLPGTTRQGSKSVRRSSRYRIHSLHQSACPALSDGRGMNRRVCTSLKVCILCTVWYGPFT